MDGEQRERAVFIAEAELLEQRHDSWASLQRRQAAFWQRWSTLTTVSSAVLAGASGAAGLASAELGTAAAIAALVAAGLASVASSSGAAHRSEVAFTSAAANQALADQARAFRTIWAPHQPLTDVRARFAELSHQRDQAVTSAALKLGRRSLMRYLQRTAPSVNPRGH
ncbi:MULTISPECIES: hypothetical protein [Micromonospora]|uniref:hypothetical protein n=1 Tax=Micromonospora TaxID=1873 RepID=UPI001EE99BC0|nr:MULTISPECIES: hypothetical protein [Micromonospora]MCG5452667.1 hypothetical protein [Micromonospora hortensis]MCX5121080.1 hypothetical protein [Micromonospora sp. NBC_00362]WTI06924.1 hypothetical protein OHB44_26500 [Micromonospora sp. NBC_00821]